ncbi:unnamed protein product [Heterobilharzia americana]|nr:unnamed protein product [Heterobilharzia americana]
MQAYLLLKQNFKFLAVCTCLLTVVFLYAFILFWNPYQPSTCLGLTSINYLSEGIPHSQKDGSLFMNSASTLPFLVNELMRINHSVHNELIDLHQRRKELVDTNTILQNRVERLRSALVEHSRQIMRLTVTLDSYQQKISDITKSSTVFYHKWPLFQVQFGEENDYHTKIVNSDKFCTIESCINWDRCRGTRFLQFCTDPSVFTSSKWPQELFRSSPHFTASCNGKGSACLKLVVGSEGIEKCVVESKIITANSPTCIVLFSDSSELDKVYQKYNYSASHFNFILVAYSFPPNKFRRGFDFLLPINCDILHKYSHKICLSDAPLRLLPGRRSVLLGFEVGILFRNHIKTQFSTLDSWIIEHLELLYKRSHRRNETNSVISISIHQTTEKQKNCWSNKYKEFLLRNLLLDTDWFPCEGASSNKSIQCCFINQHLD